MRSRKDGCPCRWMLAGWTEAVLLVLLGPALLWAQESVEQPETQPASEQQTASEPPPETEASEPAAPAADAEPTASETRLAADEPAAPPLEGPLGTGRLIEIRLPLTGNADAHARTAIRRALEQLAAVPGGQDRRPTLILEIAPAPRAGGAGEGSDFERCLSLARFLSSRELAPVKTVAYLPRSIKGHGVLVAMACEEIVMAPQAEIGEAGIDVDSTQPVPPVMISSYEQMAEARRNVPEALALGMLDRDLEVLLVETEEATEFALADDLDELRADNTIVSTETLVPRGTLGLFTGREGRTYGFVKYLAANRDALASVLRLPSEAVYADQSLIGDWRPVIVEVEGPITHRTVRQIETTIGNEISQRGVNWIGLRIDSDGGELAECLRLATMLAELESNEVRTVAYVPVDASGGAALVALACDQLVMQPAAHVGGPGSLEQDPEIVASATDSIRDHLAGHSGRRWSLMAATIDPDVEILTYRNTATGEVDFFSAEEAAGLADADNWQPGVAVHEAGEPWRLDARRAQELGVAWQVVDNFDEFKELYGLEIDPPVATPNWALELVEALRSPALAAGLLAIAFIGIYVELHTPGLGIGGFIATVAFLLFFWGRFLNGTAGGLEVILFVAGLFFVLLELFVLPGFGIFGLGGGALIIASLVLASQTFVLPRSAAQLGELRNSLAVVAAACVCVFASALVLRRYLPHAPLLRTLLLNPPAEAELADLEYREAVADYAHLIGKPGRAATPLMPSGKASIEGTLVDVIAQTPLERGQKLEVVSVRGNRIMVRAVQG